MRLMVVGDLDIAAGVPSLHFHDLRHVGGTLAATTGASLKELMARLGHSSTRAALIYQHATRDRDQAIAKALGGLVREVRPAHTGSPAMRSTEKREDTPCGPCVAQVLPPAVP
jgi:hypothetical protein